MANEFLWLVFRKYTGPGLGTLSNKRDSKKRRRSLFLPPVLFPSLIIVFLFSQHCTLWSSLFPEHSPGPPWTSDYGTEDPA